MRSVCTEGLCTRKAQIASCYCRRHQRIGARQQPEGLRVVFSPGLVSHSLYSACPPRGAIGTVVSVPLPGRRATYLPGPAGGLLYVSWGGWVCGVSPWDCYRAEGR